MGDEDATLGLVCLGCIIAPKGLEKPRFLTPGTIK